MKVLGSTDMNERNPWIQGYEEGSLGLVWMSGVRWEVGVCQDEPFRHIENLDCVTVAFRFQKCNHFSQSSNRGFRTLILPNLTYF